MSARRWRQPSWVAVVLAVVGIALFVRLGIWQLDRAHQAERLLGAFDAAPKAAFEDFASVRAAPPQDRFPHVQVRGRFLADRGWLRDEQMRDGKLGVEAYAAFAPEGNDEVLLVDRGWVAWSHEPGTQPVLPPLAQGEVTLTGVYAPFPGNGIRVGGNALVRQTTWPKLTLAIDAQEIAADLNRPLLPRVLLLDADGISGFVRAWTPSVMPPERHLGYAVQWFAFAVAAGVIFFCSTTRKLTEDSMPDLRNNEIATHAVRNRNRWMFVGVVAVFVVPMLIAFALTLAGWEPKGTKAYGTLINPPRQVDALPVSLAGGEKLVWRNPQWQWTLLALPGATCAQQCRNALADLVRMRATLGRNAERLRLVYLGPALPADAQAALAPLQAGNDDTNAFADLRAKADDGLALALVDPGGYLMMRYAEGYDLGGVRRDLPKVVK